MTSGTPSDAIERMSLKKVFIGNGNGRKKFRCRAQNGGGDCVIFVPERIRKTGGTLPAKNCGNFRRTPAASTAHGPMEGRCKSAAHHGRTKSHRPPGGLV
jgi:hypothetical protein